MKVRKPTRMDTVRLYIAFFIMPRWALKQQLAIARAITPVVVAHIKGEG